jgi:hypothetical protein
MHHVRLINQQLLHFACNLLKMAVKTTKEKQTENNVQKPSQQCYSRSNDATIHSKNVFFCSIFFVGEPHFQTCKPSSQHSMEQRSNQHRKITIKHNKNEQNESEKKKRKSWQNKTASVTTNNKIEILLALISASVRSCPLMHVSKHRSMSILILPTILKRTTWTNHQIHPKRTKKPFKQVHWPKKR